MTSLSWTSKLNKNLWKLTVSTFVQPTWARLFRDLVAMWHTHLADSKRTLVACIDLTGTTARKVKQLDQPGNHLILLLGVTEAPIAAKAPGEHALLRVQHQLKTQTAAVCKPFCKIKKINQSITGHLIWFAPDKTSGNPLTVWLAPQATSLTTTLGTGMIWPSLDFSMKIATRRGMSSQSNSMRWARAMNFPSLLWPAVTEMQNNN